MSANWYQVRLTNNMIVNNVAGWSGAGISLQDTVNSSIVNNTIANNDSTATVGVVFNAATNLSTPQPAGVSSERHSLALTTLLGPGSVFSSPIRFFNNIVWHNRAFSYDSTTATARLLPELSPATVGECASGASYWDLGVLGEPLLGPTLRLNPTDSILTDTAGYDDVGSNNLSADPSFLSAYCNGARELSAAGPMQVAPAIAEGGNFIDVRYRPADTDLAGRKRALELPHREWVRCTQHRRIRRPGLGLRQYRSTAGSWSRPRRRRRMQRLERLHG